MSNHTPVLNLEEIGRTPIVQHQVALGALAATTTTQLFLNVLDEINIDDILIQFRDDVELDSSNDSQGSLEGSGATGTLNLRILNPGQDWVDGVDMLDADFDFAVQSENALNSLSASAFASHAGGINVVAVNTMPQSAASRKLYRGQRVECRVTSPANMSDITVALILNPYIDLEG